mgnify:FL=1
MSITHIETKGEIIINVQFYAKYKRRRKEEIRNITINGKRLPNQFVEVNERKQLFKIDIGSLSEGKHQFSATLHLTREDIPVSYKVVYEFEI